VSPERLAPERVATMLVLYKLLDTVFEVGMIGKTNSMMEKIWQSFYGEKDSTKLPRAMAKIACTNFTALRLDNDRKFNLIIMSTLLEGNLWVLTP